MELWACLALPRLSLEVAFGPSPMPPDAAVAVTAGPASRPHIVAASPAAQAAGIRPGMSPIQAQALQPALRLRRRDAAAEAGRMQTLGALAYRFSSQVILADPATILLEVGASLGLFGGWQRLQQRLRGQLAALGHAHAIAAAPTPTAAEVFAGLADGFVVRDAPHLTRALARVPLARAGLTAPQLQALARLGLRRLGELQALPRPGLLRRYGPALVHHLDRLTGVLSDVRGRYRPAERFERRIGFEYGVVSSQALMFPLRRLVDELALHLQVRDGGVPGFELRLEHEGFPPSARRIGLRRPSRDAMALFDAARGRLEQHRLPHPAHGLALVAEELPPFEPERHDLFDPRSRGSMDFDALVERLRARLGDDAVAELALYPEHRPERAWRHGPAPDTPPPPLPPRPSWLLPRPIPLRQRVLRLLDAPERIESGWWDGRDIRREYVIAELEGGQRAWLFREIGAGDRTDAPLACQAGWMLHGWFA